MTSDVFIAGLIGMTFIAFVIIALSSWRNSYDDQEEKRQDD